jgi:hypothetical protein
MGLKVYNFLYLLNIFVPLTQLPKAIKRKSHQRRPAQDQLDDLKPIGAKIFTDFCFVCLSLCVRACVYACVRVSVCVFVSVCMCVAKPREKERKLEFFFFSLDYVNVVA